MGVGSTRKPSVVKWWSLGVMRWPCPRWGPKWVPEVVPNHREPPSATLAWKESPATHHRSHLFHPTLLGSLVLEPNLKIKPNGKTVSLTIRHILVIERHIQIVTFKMVKLDEG